MPRFCFPAVWNFSSGFSRGLNRNQRLMRGAQRPEIAIAAIESRLGGKISRTNLVRHFRDLFLRRLERLRVSRRCHGLVIHQVVEHQPRRFEVQHLARRQRVDAELEILRRFLRVPGLPGFVIEDFDFALIQAVHLVHAARHDHVVRERQLERLLLKKHVRGRGRIAAVERLQLLAPRLAVFLFLVFVRESR